MKSKNPYSKPVDKKCKISKGKSPAHKGKLKYAIDFLVPEGTPVRAALEGRVVYVKQGSKIGGPHRKYWFHGNRIVIKHENNEYSAYEHLKYRGARVKVGQTVKTGQIIGYSGNTGYTFEPHLHFEVFRFTGPNRKKDFETLEVSFKRWKEK